MARSEFILTILGGETLKKKDGKRESFILNQKAHNFYRSKIRLLAMNMFIWEGLPEGIPSRFIEQTLYHYGILGFYDDSIYGLVCCKTNQSNMVNMYNESLAYNLYADNGYQKLVKRNEVILLRNNFDEIPTNIFTDYYIKRLYEIDRTIDVNVIHQKTNKILQCEESQRLTIQNLMMDMQSNVPVIYGTKNLDIDGLKPIDLTMPYVADKLQSLKNDIWRECLDTLGINNANTTKKERLITDEVNSNNQYLEIASDVFLQTRQLACDELNERFGLNVTVKRRELTDGEIYSGIGYTD